MLLWRARCICHPMSAVRSLAVDLSDLFPAADYEFRMGIRRGEPAEFFRASKEREQVLAERCRWLTESPEDYRGVLPGGQALVAEAIGFLIEWGAITEEESWMIRREPDPEWRLRALGERVESDMLFLAPGKSGQMELLAGCVCFPSSWALAEKLGRPMTEIHSAAPGLNSSLGNQIDTFLTRLRPGTAWLRSNWGLSASAELNQHPDRRLPRLTEECRLEEAWLRIERQALVLLPASGGVLFALRIETGPLDVLKRESPENARRLAHSLHTMPEEIARYKGLALARAPLIEQLGK
ncbi:MAG: DUF3445 domain-containing protein [Verrucomicrobiaceae bacterium]|nr:MAG: DUF3445 domain-containing protein [Verrucomicrobiaceae bacterium]